MGKPRTAKKAKSPESTAKSTPERKSGKKTGKTTLEKARHMKTVKKGKTLAVDLDAERDGGSSCSGAGASSASLWLPMSRVWRLVRGEGVNSGVTARTTLDVVFLINKASELFLEKLVKDAYFIAKKARPKAIRYNDLALNVNNKKRYEFLSDFVPEKISAEDALKAQNPN